MIHKINLKGYITGSPFKLMYLADEEGITDLADAYPVLLLIPIVKDFKEELLAWASSTYTKVHDSEKNRYIYKSWREEDSEYAERLQVREENVAHARQLVEDCVLALSPILEESTALLVPITLNKDRGIKYLINKNSAHSRGILKIEKGLAEAAAHKNWGGWYASQEEYYRKMLLKHNSAVWISKSKLLIKGEVKRHPCVMCPNAFDSLQGACAFGGSTCQENLSTLFKEKVKC